MKKIFLTILLSIVFTVSVSRNAYATDISNIAGFWDGLPSEIYGFLYIRPHPFDSSADASSFDLYGTLIRRLTFTADGEIYEGPTQVGTWSYHTVLEEEVLVIAVMTPTGREITIRYVRGGLIAETEEDEGDI